MALAARLYISESPNRLENRGSVSARIQIFLLVVWLVCSILKEANIAVSTSVLTSCCYVAVFFLFVYELTGNYRYNKLEILALCVFIPVLWFQGFYLGNTGFAQLFSLIFIFRNVDKTSLFRVVFYVMAVTVFAVAALSLAGIIPDVYVQEVGGNHSRQARGSFGFSWPSRIQTYLLILLCLYMAYKEEHYKVAGVIALSIAAIIIGGVTDAKLPLYLTLVVAALCLFMKLRPGFSFSKRKAIGGLVALSFLIAVGLSFALPVLYSLDSPSMESLNQLLTGRLYLSAIAIDSREITLFGTVLYANQGTTAGELLRYGYFDCGYLNFLYAFGVIPGLVFLTSLTKGISKTVSNNECFSALALFTIAVLSMFYSHALMTPSYGIVLLLVGNVFACRGKATADELHGAHRAMDRAGVMYG